MEPAPRTVLVTGAAGFIGYHLCERLLADGYVVVGVDAMTDYYDPRIKKARLALLKKHANFSFEKLSLTRYGALERLLRRSAPQEIVHLAAQAGVRYSLTNPWAYADANYLGTLNVFEAAKAVGNKRVIYASSSSVYGANEKQPFSEEDRTDRQISIYAASKKANESLAYSYHHLYDMEMIGLRFFTVYGSWGRPDMALFKFAKAIMTGKPIELYNQGNMRRSFTHVSDIVGGIAALLARPAANRYDLYNLGGAAAVPLRTFVELIEKELGKTTEHILQPLQPGDVPETVADCAKALRDVGYTPKISIEEGITEFATWFRENEAFLRSLADAKQ